MVLSSVSYHSKAKEVIEEINKHKKICQVGFMRRFASFYPDVKRRIEKGDIGDPIYYKGISRNPGSPSE